MRAAVVLGTSPHSRNIVATTAITGTAHIVTLVLQCGRCLGPIQVGLIAVRRQTAHAVGYDYAPDFANSLEA